MSAEILNIGKPSFTNTRSEIGWMRLNNGAFFSIDRAFSSLSIYNSDESLCKNIMINAPNLMTYTFLPLSSNIGCLIFSTKETPGPVPGNTDITVRCLTFLDRLFIGASAATTFCTIKDDSTITLTLGNIGISNLEVSIIGNDDNGNFDFAIKYMYEKSANNKVIIITYSPSSLSLDTIELSSASLRMSDQQCTNRANTLITTYLDQSNLQFFSYFSSICTFIGRSGSGSTYGYFISVLQTDFVIGEGNSRVISVSGISGRGTVSIGTGTTYFPVSETCSPYSTSIITVTGALTGTFANNVIQNNIVNALRYQGLSSEQYFALSMGQGTQIQLFSLATTSLYGQSVQITNSAINYVATGLSLTCPDQAKLCMTSWTRALNGALNYYLFIISPTSTDMLTSTTITVFQTLNTLSPTFVGIITQYGYLLEVLGLYSMPLGSGGSFMLSTVSTFAKLRNKNSECSSVLSTTLDNSLWYYISSEGGIWYNQNRLNAQCSNSDILNGRCSSLDASREGTVLGGLLTCSLAIRNLPRTKWIYVSDNDIINYMPRPDTSDISFAGLENLPYVMDMVINGINPTLTYSTSAKGIMYAGFPSTQGWINHKNLVTGRLISLIGYLTSYDASSSDRYYYRGLISDNDGSIGLLNTCIKNLNAAFQNYNTLPQSLTVVYNRLLQKIGASGGTIINGYANRGTYGSYYLSVSGDDENIPLISTDSNGRTIGQLRTLLHEITHAVCGTVDENAMHDLIYDFTECKKNADIGLNSELIADCVTLFLLCRATEFDCTHLKSYQAKRKLVTESNDINESNIIEEEKMNIISTIVLTGIVSCVENRICTMSVTLTNNGNESYWISKDTLFFGNHYTHDYKVMGPQGLIPCIGASMHSGRNFADIQLNIMESITNEVTINERCNLFSSGNGHHYVMISGYFPLSKTQGPINTDDYALRNLNISFYLGDHDNLEHTPIPGSNESMNGIDNM